MGGADRYVDAGGFWRRSRSRAAAPLARIVWLAAIVVSQGLASPLPRTDAVRIDLVESLPAAEVSRGFTTLEFDDSAQASLLTAGWGPMARPSEDEAFAWTSGRVAVVDVSLVDTRPRQLVLDVSSFDPPGSLPDQRLRVLWNGRLLRNAKVSKESQQLRLPVPSRAQFVGPNRIELQPRYWMGGGRAQRGVLVSRLSVEGVSADQQSGPAATAEDGSAIAQELDSVVTYWLLMPAGARLRGAVRLEGESPGDKAEAAVYVMEEAGEQQRVAAVGGARLGDGGRPIDVDLGAESPRAVALTLAATGPADGARVIWSDLRIEAERRVPPGRDWARRKYNVIFVLLDTLRADHTEPYGSTAVQTPRMRELADAGVTFTNAYSTASFTRSAVASLFTSLYPEAHRVLTREDNLTAELAGLPAALRDHGFATLALINNSHVGVQFGFGNGFDRVEEVYSSPIRKEFRKTDGPRQHAEAVWSRLVQPFLDQHSGKPFFLYLHEIDPHGPYMPKAPYNRMYDFGYTGRLSSHSQVLRAINQGEISVEDEDVRHFLSQYDGEISYMDEYLGWIAGHLRENGIFAAPRYVGKPAFECQVFREKRTFGNSQWPYSDPSRAGLPDVDHDRANFPGSVKALSQILVIPWNEHYTDEHVDFIAARLHEVVGQKEGQR